jgi:hypothetical protein
MSLTRKFLYAAVLALSSLTPALVAGQEMARGEFNLPHDVHWQNASVPAGQYRFTFEGSGAGGMLVLSKMDGLRAGFLFLVSETSDSVNSSMNRIVLETTPQGSYVSAMELPEYAMTLHFRLPRKAATGVVAKAAVASSMSAQ